MSIRARLPSPPRARAAPRLDEVLRIGLLEGRRVTQPTSTNTKRELAVQIEQLEEELKYIDIEMQVLSTRMYAAKDRVPNQPTAIIRMQSLLAERDEKRKKIERLKENLALLESGAQKRRMSDEPGFYDYPKRYRSLPVYADQDDQDPFPMRSLPVYPSDDEKPIVYRNN